MSDYYLLTDEQLRNIPGSDKIFGWYGHWPTLHDSYLLDVHFSTWDRSYVRLHVYRSFDRSEGSEAILTIFLNQIMSNELTGIGDQLLGVTFFRSSAGLFKVLIEGAIHVSSLIEANEIAFDLRTWPLESSQ